MHKPFPALCRDCKHSKPEPNSSWSLNCHHPAVNGNDPFALTASIDFKGTNCRYERERKCFAKCGIRGKLWEPKHE
jgi:hypothetical protein